MFPGSRDGEEQDRRVGRVVETMPEARERFAREPPEVPDTIESRGRSGAERGEDPLDAGLNRFHAPVGKRRGDPSHDLDILRPSVPTKEQDRVGFDGLRSVGPIEELEPFAEEALPRGRAHREIV